MEIPKARYKHDKRPGSKRRPGRVAGWAISLLLLISASGYSFLALTKAVPPLSAAPAIVQVRAAEEVKIIWPTAVDAAIGGIDEGVLAKSSQEEQAKPIASMTKIVTALAVMDKSPIVLGEQGPVYTFTSSDVAIYNSYLAKFGSVMPVRAGQQLTQYEMLQGMLLPSGNNVADTLVNWLFGSEDAYIKYANELVRSWGLEETVIDDASGFSPDTVSTPSELIVIGQKALKNQVIAEIVSQKEAVVPDSGIIRNTNRLLFDENVTGIKTGTTDEAGSCLLFSVKHGPNKEKTLIGVVMGAATNTSVLSSARALRDSALANFGMVEVLAAGSVVGSYDTPWGQSSDIVTSDAIEVYDWKASKHDLIADIKPADSPLKQGQVIGQARLEGREELVDLVAATEITPPSSWWKLTNYWN